MRNEDRKALSSRGLRGETRAGEITHVLQKTEGRFDFNKSTPVCLPNLIFIPERFLLLGIFAFCYFAHLINITYHAEFCVVSYRRRKKMISL